MPSTDAGNSRLNAIAGVGCAIFALPLFAHAYAGTASRYLGDDYCAGYVFRDYGFIGGQVWHYKSWSAVPTTLLLMALTEPGGAWLAPMLPAAALAIWLASAAWAVRQLSSWTGRPWSWLLSVCLAEVLVYATLQDAPNVAQSLYLRVPMLAYTCPLIVLSLYVGWFARAVRHDRFTAPAMGVSAALAFVFGAFGPVCAAFLTAALSLTGVVARAEMTGPRRRALQRLCIAGLGGAILALAVVAFAPGNAARQVYFPSPPGLLKVGIWSVLYTVFLFCRPIVPLLQPVIVSIAPRVLGETPRWLPTALAMGTSPLPLATVIVLFGLIASRTWESTTAGDSLGRACWWIPVAAFVLVCACMAPGAYGTSAPPPPRALIIPQYVMTSLAAFWGIALAATVVAPRLRKAAMPRAAVSALSWTVVACLSIGPLIAAVHVVAAGEHMRDWAHRWDETDVQIRFARASGTRDAVVPALEPLAGVGSIGQDPHDWVNICAAKYYGLTSITGSADLP